jgi:hypothetical protein
MGFGAAGSACGGPTYDMRPLVQLFWVERHDATTWPRLLADVQLVEDELPYAALRRMAEIVPADRLDAWEIALRLQQRGNFQIAHFCSWLEPAYRDVLRVYFTHSDQDWAECPWLAYLDKLPTPVASHMWRMKDNLPMWQSLALDRLLHAPSSLRPPPVVHDVQSVEGDCRLEDPFLRRGF